MKALKKIGLLLGILILIYLVLALIGPSNYKITRTVTIAAPVDIVFEQTSKFENWAKWSPWAKMDPNAKYEILTDNQQSGSIMKWEGNPDNVGTGEMEVTEVEKNKSFKYILRFKVPFEMQSRGGFNYSQNGDSTHLEWVDEGDFAFMSRPMMLFMDLEAQVGPQFEQGLNDIKSISEKLAKKPAIEITEEIVQSKEILFIKEKSTLNPDSISTKMGAAYGEIMALLSVAQLDMAGAPMAITKEFSMQKMSWEFLAAIPVLNMPDDLELSGRIQSDTTYAGRAIKAVHVGSYSTSNNTYDALMNYIEENGLEINGYSWEEFINDPAEVEESELITHIYFPVK